MTGEVAAPYGFPIHKVPNRPPTDRLATDVGIG